MNLFKNNCLFNCLFKNKKALSILTYPQDYEQFSSRGYNISIIQNISYIVASITTDLLLFYTH